jgi:hypothetical protein
MSVIPTQPGDACKYGLLQEDGSALASMTQPANNNIVFIFYYFAKSFLEFIQRDQDTCS